jgi:hypothetical protein
MSLSGNLNFTGIVFLLCLLGYMVLLSANQFLEVPYTALPFWMVYGALLACIRISKTGAPPDLQPDQFT